MMLHCVISFHGAKADTDGGEKQDNTNDNKTYGKFAKEAEAIGTEPLVEGIADEEREEKD